MEGFQINDTFPGYFFYKYIECKEEMWWHLRGYWFFILIWITNALNICFVIMGLILNLISFKILSRDTNDTVIRLVLRYLAIFDVLVLLINTADATCHTSESIQNLSLNFRFFITYFHSFLWIFQASFVTIRNYTVTYLAVCRCCCIAFPFRSRRIFNKRVTFWYLNLLWVLILPINFPKLLEVTTRIAECPEGLHMAMGGSQYMSVAYTWLTSIIFNSAFPMMICVAANIFLICVLRRTDDTFNRRSVQRIGGSAQQLNPTKTVFFLSIMFVICQVPMFLYGVVVMYVHSVWLFAYFNLLATLINDIDSSCNFFVYTYTNPRFRVELVRICPFLSGLISRLEQRIAQENSSSRTSDRRVIDTELNQV